MKTFYSSKNKFMTGFVWLLVLFLTIMLFVQKKESEASFYMFYLTMIPVIAGLVWILLATKYTITKNQLHYYSGPLRGKIEIVKIKKIKQHSGWIIPSILKPGLDYNGLILFYNQFDTIYISPKHQSEFLAELIRINPKIEIENPIRI